MAIDSSLFAVDLPAGSYPAGTVVSLGCIAGPANVRSGRGTAILKQIQCGVTNNVGVFWEVYAKNSDWIDSVQSLAGEMTAPTAFDPESGSIQAGADCNLTGNSGWEIYAVAKIGGTTTADHSLWALIDIDYPQVSAIQNPAALVGFPTSIDFEKTTVNVHAYGTLTASSWDLYNVDYFKAGYEYVLKNVEVLSSNAVCGFMAFSNAAGMGGLQRIIPVNNIPVNIRQKIKYASKLQKGPMDVKLLMLNTAASTGQSLYAVHDYVKRAI